MSQGLKTFYSALLWKNITVSLLFMKVLGILCISLFYPWCIHLELTRDIFSHIIQIQYHEGTYYQLFLQSSLHADKNVSLKVVVSVH